MYLVAGNAKTLEEVPLNLFKKWLLEKKIGQEFFQKIDDFFNFTLLGTQSGMFSFISTC